MFLVERHSGAWQTVDEQSELWIAKETAAKSAKPTTPTRVIDLRLGRVVYYHGGRPMVASKKIANIDVDGCAGNPISTWTQCSAAKRSPMLAVPASKEAEEEPLEVAVEEESRVEPEDLDEPQTDTEPLATDVHAPRWDGHPKAALLLSGGLFSTATLIALAKTGFHVTPFFVHGSDSVSDRGVGTARAVVLGAAAALPPGSVDKLEVIYMRTPNVMAHKRRRRYVRRLNQELAGVGMNMIVYGKQSAFEVGVNEEHNLDRQVLAMQELTSIEVISPEALGCEDLPSLLGHVESQAERDLIYISTSCEAPPVLLLRECGECDACIRRYRMLTALFGKDRTRYMQGSTVRLMRQHGLTQVPAKGAVLAARGTDDE